MLKGFLSTILALFVICAIYEPSPSIDVEEPPIAMKAPRPKNVRMYIAVDADFTDDEKDLIIEGAEMWQEATNNTVEFTFLYSYIPNFKFEHDPDTVVLPVIMRHLDEDNYFTQYIDLILEGEILGYYKRDEAIPTIYIVRTRISSFNEYILVAAHEFSHAMQIGHVYTKGALMYPNIRYVDGCITQYDVGVFCDIYHCNIDDMNPCVIEEQLVCPNEGI